MLPCTMEGESRLLILGGNSIARIDQDGLDYEYEKDTNESTNLTGISLPSQEILELFDLQQPFKFYVLKHSIRIGNPSLLHDGCVIPLSNSYLLLLPGCKSLIQVRIFSKEINIIEGNEYEYLPCMKAIQQR